MADERRLDRVGQQMRDELGALIDIELDDPRIGLITVTHVQLSRDMRHARVYVSGAGNQRARDETIAGLQSARGLLRRQLSLRLPHLKRTPELTFEYDGSVESGMRVEELLDEISQERDDEDD
jgi:ribosome-binding factor A